MQIPGTRFRSSHLLACIAASSLLAVGLAEEDIVPPPTDEVHTVKLGALEVDWEADLRLKTTRSRPVKIGTDQYSRGTEIKEILIRSGMVRKGDTILRLDTTDIDKSIKDAKTALDEKKTRIEITSRTRKIETESMKIALEKNVKADERARRNLELFEKFRAEMMKQREKMGLEWSKYRVDDQEEELRQLQEMYGDTTLADQTKDIVLNRAKRSLNMTERNYKMAETDYKLFQDYSFPEREQDIQDQTRWQKTSLDHLHVQQQLTRMRWELDTARDERSLKDLQENLDELQADRDRFTVKAPINGILTEIKLEAGDDVSMQQNIAEVQDPSKMVLNGTIDANDLNVITEGMRVNIDVSAFPGLELTGTVDSIGLIGSPSGKSTSFPIEIKLSGSDDRLRLGLACNATASKTLRSVLIAPKEGVHTEGDRSWVTLRRGENTVEQDVVTGLSNKDSVQIISGLKAGDQIVISTEDSDSE